MKQVVQAVSGGPVRVIDVPEPTITTTEVLVQTVATVISAGTERAVTQLAQSSLLAKARARPDLVRQTFRKARREGIASTVTAVRTRLGGDLALGYSGAGVVVEVGEAVEGIRPGQVVATGGGGFASHAELQAVPRLLCTPVPDDVDPGQAALATIASIPLHALRLADLGPGSRVVVVGLGLIGQIAVRLAHASGCAVAGIDVAEYPVARARDAGALSLVDRGEETTDVIRDWSRGRGADAVIVTAAGRTPEPLVRSPALCRDRATIVVVGDVAINIDRAPLYDRELSLRFARSYGPGRYERTYEDWGVDYPAGHVRWTEGRNAEAIVDLLGMGRVDFAPLITHRFPIDQAPTAYELIEARTEPYLAVRLDYPDVPPKPTHVAGRPLQRPKREPGIGMIGAGNFAAGVLVPALTSVGFGRLRAVTSASGLSAARLAERAGFERAVSGIDAVLEDPEVDVVVVATPHDTHADVVVRALEAGKHVWCEKPLALTLDDLDRIEDSWQRSDKVLMVGFNRRWSPSITWMREHFPVGSGPLVMTYRVSAGAVPPGHWYEDRRQGGRLVGEACHFVDTCDALTDGVAVRLEAVGDPNDAFTICMSYADGSTAAITYAAGGDPRTPKERLEVLGRGHSAVTDYVTLTFDQRRVMSGREDKGHRNAVRHFRGLVVGGTVSAAIGIESSRAVLVAAQALRGGTGRG